MGTYLSFWWQSKGRAGKDEWNKSPESANCCTRTETRLSIRKYQSYRPNEGRGKIFRAPTWWRFQRAAREWQGETVPERARFLIGRGNREHRISSRDATCH